jgi:hypothetical protein
VLKSYFGVFTHWMLREFDTSLYLTECYDNFVDFKWEIPDEKTAKKIIARKDLDHL